MRGAACCDEVADEAVEVALAGLFGSQREDSAAGVIGAGLPALDGGGDGFDRKL